MNSLKRHFRTGFTYSLLATLLSKPSRKFGECRHTKFSTPSSSLCSCRGAAEFWRSTRLIAHWDRCRKEFQLGVTPLRDDDYSAPVGWIRGLRRSAQFVKSTSRVVRNTFGIEIQVKSMKNVTGSLSWIEIPRGMSKCVEEINEEKGESSYHEEIASGYCIGKPIGPQSDLVLKIFVPIDQGKWNDIPAVNDVI